MKHALGNVSLLVVGGLFLGCEAARRLGWATGPWIGVLAAAFEAGTVGALADGFAVRALFREVPIPFLRRHTNILLRKRQELTEGIVDVVQNQWLTPAAIGDYLSGRSPSGAVLAYLSDPRHEAQLLDALRGVVAGMVERLDGPETAGFLGTALRDQLEREDLARMAGERLRDAVGRGDHHPVADALLASVEGALREGTLRSHVSRWMEDAARSYAERSTVKLATTWLLERTGGLNYDRAADDIVDAVARSVAGAKGDPEHPLRRRVDAAVERWARGLAEGGPSERSAFERFRKGLLDGLEQSTALREILARLKGTLMAQLDDPQSPLREAAAQFLRQRLAEVREDAALRARIDAWILQTAVQAVARNHAMIGEMVRTSLAKLQGPELVSQIESKVGGELQYIRLNGAVIGTLVGLGFGLIKLALSR